MHAALMWTISDFLAYDDLSGCRTKGCAACPYCMGNTRSKRLRNGEIYCYMGHRRWLPMEHSFRTDSLSFDGTQEMDISPIVPNGDEIMLQLEGVQCVADQPYIKEKKKDDIAKDEPPVFWKKKKKYFLHIALLKR